MNFLCLRLPVLALWLRAGGPFLRQIEMNCVKEVHWVALGTPLRGVAVTLSPGAGNNRWNQLLWEPLWLSGGAVYRRLVARLRPDAGLRQLPHGLSERGPAGLQTCVCVQRSASITRSPYDTLNTMKFIYSGCLMDKLQVLHLQHFGPCAELVWTRVALFYVDQENKLSHFIPLQFPVVSYILNCRMCNK